MDWSSLTPAVVIALCSLVTAFCSFFVALSNYRKSNYAVVRVLSVRTSCAMEVGRGMYHYFTIVIQNLGIPLHNVAMRLEFSPEHGFGWCNTPLKTADGKSVREGQFAKGAITEFTFATDRFEGADDGFLRALTDLKSQHAQLTVSADRYKMWALRLHDRLWFLKRRWNRFAFWLTERFRRQVKTPRGTPGVKYLIEAPKFKSPGRELLEFAEYVRERPPVSQQTGFVHPFIPPQAKPA